MASHQRWLFENNFPVRRAIYKALICGTFSSLASDPSQVLRLVLLVYLIPDFPLLSNIIFNNEVWKMRRNLLDLHCFLFRSLLIFPELSEMSLNLYTLRLLEQGMFPSRLSSSNLISAYQLPKY